MSYYIAVPQKVITDPFHSLLAYIYVESIAETSLLVSSRDTAREESIEYRYGIIFKMFNRPTILKSCKQIETTLLFIG